MICFICVCHHITSLVDISASYERIKIPRAPQSKSPAQKIRIIMEEREYRKKIAWGVRPLSIQASSSTRYLSRLFLTMPVVVCSSVHSRHKSLQILRHSRDFDNGVERAALREIDVTLEHHGCKNKQVGLPPVENEEPIWPSRHASTRQRACSAPPP